jgi:hypothetical protein
MASGMPIWPPAICVCIAHPTLCSAALGVAIGQPRYAAGVNQERAMLKNMLDARGIRKPR